MSPETAKPASAAAAGRGPANKSRIRRQLVMLVVIGLAPVVASYAIYYGWPRERQVNYGTLHAVAAPALAGRSASGAAFALADLRGKWVLVSADGGACAAPCGDKLYATRQARTIQNAERDRIARLWLVTDDADVPPAVTAEHPDVMVVRVTPAAAAALPAGTGALYLVDPLGNVVLSWPAVPDVKAVAKDIARLLRASRIG